MFENKGQEESESSEELNEENWDKEEKNILDKLVC